MKKPAYIDFGTFEEFRAARILEAYAKAGIRVNVSVSGGINREWIIARVGVVGSSFEKTVSIAVHKDDAKKARKILDVGNH